MNESTVKAGRFIVAFVLVMASSLGLAVVPALAGPAAPVVMLFEQPDGTKLYLRLWGNELANGWETLDGFTVLQNVETGFWEYAIRSEDGELVTSGLVVGEAAPPGQPHLRPSEEVIEQAAEDLGVPPPGSETHNSPPPWAGGNTNVLVIMVQFPADAGDPNGAQPAVNCTFSAANMQANLFGGAASGPGDMTDYYQEISYGDLNLIGTGTGTIQRSRPIDDYSVVFAGAAIKF